MRKRLLQNLTAVMFLTAAWLGVVTPAGAQTQAKTAGKIVEVAPGWVKVAAGNNLIAVAVSPAELLAMFPDPNAPKKFSLVLNGTAEPEFLARDQFVSFSAEIVGGRTGKEEVNELMIFTPDDSHPLQMLDKAPSGDDEPPTADHVGSYLVSGRVQSFVNGELTVAVPQGRREQKIKIRVAPKARITVRVADASFARVGDLIDAAGYTSAPAGQHVSSIVAETVKIDLAKPLTGRKRAKPVVASKPARKPAPEKPASERQSEPEAKPAQEPLVASADRPSEASKPKVARVSGDPPAEELMLKDEFSVDQSDADQPSVEKPSVEKPARAGRPKP